MAQLAIRGHAKRGKEVIEILEMLGGKDYGNLIGAEPLWGYYINSDGEIDFQHSSYFYDAIQFTLEEFLENYPYKVGDKVIYHESEAEIVSVKWDGMGIVYTVNRNDELWDTSAINLQSYKEVPMYLNEKANKQADEIKEILKPAKEIMDEMKLDIPEGYEFFGIDDDNKVVLTKKQPQYPKTYVKCCNILDVDPYSKSTGYKSGLITAFRNLLICRDAYWKIAGEQMGLGEPWKPDWLNTAQDKYVLYTHDNVICLNHFVLGHNVLAFPTAEMRDAFLENFKELIELCKELL